MVGDDWKFKGKGANSSGDSFGAAPNIDHSAPEVKQGLSEWLQWMRSELGFDGWRCAAPSPAPCPIAAPLQAKLQLVSALALFKL